MDKYSYRPILRKAFIKYLSDIYLDDLDVGKSIFLKDVLFIQWLDDYDLHEIIDRYKEDWIEFCSLPENELLDFTK